MMRRHRNRPSVTVKGASVTITTLPTGVSVTVYDDIQPVLAHFVRTHDLDAFARVTTTPAFIAEWATAWEIVGVEGDVLAHVLVDV